MKRTKSYIIRNEDCKKTIKHMKQKGIKVDCVITSPPYNTSRKVRTKKENRNIKCICSEIDKEQCEYGKERLLNG